MPREIHKTAPVSLKAISDADEPGTFEALISVYGNVDADGEIVTLGAFKKTLAEDGPHPIVWSHDWMVPPIGETVTATETDKGLLVKGRLFVRDGEDHPVARQVYAGMRAGALRQFSWGGRVTSETRKEDDDGAVTYELNEIELTEYGPCLRGANEETALVAVKSLVADGKVTRADARKALEDAQADAGALSDSDPAPNEAGSENGSDGLPAGSESAELSGPLIDAVRAGVMTVAEARERLGLSIASDENAPAEQAPAAAVAHEQAVAMLDLAS